MRREEGWPAPDLAFQRIVRAWSIGAGCGFLAGFFVLGLGLRLAMRVSGALTSPENGALATDAGMVVGRITLGGSLGLILFVAAVGVSGGLLYQLLRPAIPGRGWAHALATGALVLTLYGASLVDPDNFDFVTFGPAALNVVMYGSVLVLYGVALARLVDHFDGALPKPPQRPRKVALAMGPVLLSLPALPAFVIPISDAEFPHAVALLVILVAALVGTAIATRMGARPATLGPRGLLAARLVVLGAVLVGAFHLARNVFDILGAGP